MDATAIYDFEGNIPSLFADAITTQGLNVFSILTPPEFRKTRPRSEVIFRPGASTSPPQLLLVNGKRRVATYTGELEINSITDPSATGKATHSTYRAQIRQAMELDAILAAVNAVYSPYHINFVSPSGSTQTIRTDEGYELSRLTYAVQFGIKADAFTQLES